MNRKPSLPAAFLLHAVLLSLSCFFLLPFAWMLLTSLKDPSEVFSRVFPTMLRFENYREALTQPMLPMGRFFLNTVFLTVTCTTVALLSSSLTAFGFARLNFAGRDVLFLCVLSTMMLPAMVMIIPQFYLFQRLGWVDTFYPFLVPALFGNAFQIFFLRQFMKTLPEELFDAGRMDGCTNFRAFLHIALPLVRPALAALAIFSFLFYWNDFMGPLIYLHSVEKRTLALGLYSFQGIHGTSWHLMMAASMLAIIPVIIVFFCLQRYFTQGIVLSGLKG